MSKVGLISDTHGRLDAKVGAIFAGVERILHAGDVGDQVVLEELSLIAPVSAVRGNMDSWPLSETLPEEVLVEIGGLRILVGHILPDLLSHHDVVAEGIAVVATGHTHWAVIENRGSVLYVNPGTAGRTRVGRPRTVALLDINDGRAQATIVALDEDAAT